MCVTRVTPPTSLTLLLLKFPQTTNSIIHRRFHWDTEAKSWAFIVYWSRLIEIILSNKAIYTVKYYLHFFCHSK